MEIKGTDRSEVVRYVSVVLHLANGQDVSYQVNEEVVMGELEDPAELAAAAQVDAEERLAIDAEEAHTVENAMKRAKAPTRSGKR